MTPRAYLQSLLPVVSSDAAIAEAVNRKFNTRLTASKIALHRPRSKTQDQKRRESIQLSSKALADAINNSVQL